MQPYRWSQAVQSKSGHHHQPPQWPQARQPGLGLVPPVVTGIMTVTPSQRPSKQHSQHNARLVGGAV